MAWKTLFCGTPQFAVNAARVLDESHEYNLKAVLTQPDRRSGRGQKLKACPVKQFALDKGIPTYSPEKAKDPQFIESLRLEKFDLAIVAAYGQILSEDFLTLFPLGAFNIHGSLLPRWRGAAPIQRALMAGDKVGGVCLQEMVFQLDAGDIVGQDSMEIPIDLGAREYFKTLALKGAKLLEDPLPRYLRGEFEAKPQDQSIATYAKKILKDEAQISWDASADVIHNFVRGLNAGPVARTYWKGAPIKVSQTRAIQPFSSTENDGCSETNSFKPGAVCNVGRDSFFVQTGHGVIEILLIQPSGKKTMSSGDFIRGYQVKKGDQFESKI